MRKEIKRLNEEQIATAISDIQKLCEYDVTGKEFTKEEKINKLMFAMKILIKIPTEQKSPNGLIISSPIVTKRVIEDLNMLLKSRREILKNK